MDNEVKIVNRVSITTMIGNTILSLFKFIAGILSKSSALVSDAIHSLSDVISTVIVMIGVKISSKKADADHPFGHERIESVASIILSIMLGGVGVFIGYSGIKDIVLFHTQGIVREITDFTLLALIAAAISIVVKEGMYWYTIIAAKKINSTALKADAWHHRSDAFSSVGSLIGIIGAMFKIYILDAYASVIICVFILVSAITIFVESLDRMVDKAVDVETQSKIKQIASSTPGVMRIDSCKTRLFGSKMYVEIEIEVDGEISVKAGHKIAENVHSSIEKEITGMKHCAVHVNPSDDDY